VSRSRGAQIAGIIVAAAVLGHGEARADEGSTVITVVRPPGTSALLIEAIARLSAELQAAGFTVRTIEASGDDGRAEVERVEGSFATIAIVTTEVGAVADVWVADRLTGKTVVRRVDVIDPALPTAASDLAVRSVELLRASLLELHEPTQRRRNLPDEITRFAAASPPPAPALPAPARPMMPVSSSPPSALAKPRAPEPAIAARATRSSSLGASVEAAAALLLSPDAGASFRPLLRVAIDFPAGFSLRLAAAIPFDTTTLVAANGTVDIRQTLVTLDAAYVIGPSRWRVRPVGSIGGGFYALRVDGTAVKPFVGEHHDATAGFAAAGVGVRVGLTERLTVLADVQSVVLFPEQLVTATGKTLAHLGRPLFLPSLGLIANF
jgi:hypothetical protein